jgi:hypothetical protein
MQTAVSHLQSPSHVTGYMSGLGRIIYVTARCIAAALLPQTFAHAQVNNVGEKPYLGWSTFSEQTIVPSSTVMNEQNILAQSDAMRSSGLEDHGFRYINLDAGWSGNSDEYGRTLWNTTAFPHFLDMIQPAHLYRYGILPGKKTPRPDRLLAGAYLFQKKKIRPQENV